MLVVVLAAYYRGNPKDALIVIIAFVGAQVLQWPVYRAGGRYVLAVRADSDGLHAMTTGGRVRIGWNSLVALDKCWGGRTLLRSRDDDLVFSCYSGLGSVLTAIQQAIELNRAGHSLPRMTDAEVPSSGLSRVSAAATPADRGVSRTDP